MESVDRNNRHIGSTSATLALAGLLALLLFPGNAYAQDSNPIDAGICRELEKNEDDELLALDAEVLNLWAEFGLNQPESLAEALSALCESGKNTVDAIKKPSQDILGENETKNPDSGDTQQGEIDGESETTTTSPPQNTISPSTDTSENTEDSQSAEDSDTSVAGTPTASPPGTGAQGGGPARATIDRLEGTTSAPSTTERDRGDTFAAQQHTNHDAQEPGTLDRLPFLLAVISLVVVAAALAHTWARRKLLH